MKRYGFIICLLAILFAACEREIPYNGEYQDAKLVIQALVCSGEDSIVCFVNRSYFFLDSKPSQPQPLEGVSMDIASSMGELHILSDRVEGSKHILHLSGALQAGDTISLYATHPELGTAVAREIIMPTFVPEVTKAVMDTMENMLMLTLRMPDYPFPNSIIGINATYVQHYESIVGVFDPGDNTFLGWDTVYITGHGLGIASRDEVFSLLENEMSNGVYHAYYKYLQFMADYPSCREISFFMTNCMNRTYVYDNLHVKKRTNWVDSVCLHFEVYGESYNNYVTSMQAYTKTRVDDRNDANILKYFSERTDMEQTAVFSNVENGYGVLISKTVNSLPVNDWTFQ